MTTHSAVDVFGTVGLPFVGVGILVVGLIVVALCLKNRVRAAFWTRSSGFILEADGERIKKITSRQ
jgi:ABC-type spermidine/putrescine transport system permease subunit II